MLPKSDIFLQKIEARNIEQGVLGDCYFLAGLSALAERPDRIIKLFHFKKKKQVQLFFCENSIQR